MFNIPWNCIKPITSFSWKTSYPKSITLHDSSANLERITTLYTTSTWKTPQKDNTHSIDVNTLDSKVFRLQKVFGLFASITFKIQKLGILCSVAGWTFFQLAHTVDVRLPPLQNRPVRPTPADQQDQKTRSKEDNEIPNEFPRIFPPKPPSSEELRSMMVTALPPFTPHRGWRCLPSSWLTAIPRDRHKRLILAFLSRQHPHVAF